jgi:hypothetical protein
MARGWPETSGSGAATSVFSRSLRTTRARACLPRWHMSTTCLSRIIRSGPITSKWTTCRLLRSEMSWPELPRITSWCASVRRADAPDRNAPALPAELALRDGARPSVGREIAKRAPTRNRAEARPPGCPGTRSAVAELGAHHAYAGSSGVRGADALPGRGDVGHRAASIQAGRRSARDGLSSRSPGATFRGFPHVDLGGLCCQWALSD